MNERLKEQSFLSEKQKQAVAGGGPWFCFDPY